MAEAARRQELLEELEAVMTDDDALMVVRQVRHQYRAAQALRRHATTLSVDATPEQAYRAQATENAWREMRSEFGLLTADEVARRAGAAGRSYASDNRKAGKLMGVKRLNKILYPGFQIGPSGPLPLIRHLTDAAKRLDVSEESVLLWMTAPTTWWGDDRRPVDHLDASGEILQAFEVHYGAQW